jgi:hypothetical protein
MKNTVLEYQRNKSIERVMVDYPEVSAGKPEILTAIETFAGNDIRIGEILSDLAKPRSVIFRPKHDQLRKLRVAVTRMAGMGIILATSQQDEPKAAMYKAYKLSAWSGTAWALNQQAIQIGNELEKELEVIATVGLTPEQLTAFKSLTVELANTLEITDALTKKIKSERLELKLLMKTNSGILRLQLDPFANFVQETNAGFYRDYKIARRSPLPRKSVDKTTEVLAEVSGTVSDNATGDPVANATVHISELGLVANTDSDGYFLFDEVPAGTFTLSCHATDYKLPATITVTITDTMPQDVNFGLEPEAGTQAA